MGAGSLLRFSTDCNKKFNELFNHVLSNHESFGVHLRKADEGGTCQEIFNSHTDCSLSIEPAINRELNVN